MDIQPPSPKLKNLKSELLSLLIPFLLGIASGLFITLAISSAYNERLLKKESQKVNQEVTPYNNTIAQALKATHSELIIKTQVFETGEDTIIIQTLSPKKENQVIR